MSLVEVLISMKVALELMIHFELFSALFNKAVWINVNFDA